MKCTTLDLKAITLFWFQTQKHAPFTSEGFQGLVPTSVIFYKNTDYEDIKNTFILNLMLTLHR